MAFLEATDTLLDFDLWENCFSSASPVSPVSSSLSSEGSAPQLNGSPGEDSYTTLLPKDPQGQRLASEEEFCTGLLSTFQSPSSSSASLSAEESLQLVENSSEHGPSRTEADADHSPNDENGSGEPPKTVKEKAQNVSRTTRVNNNLPPCRICADAASGFHYGVNSCEACKRFFRRALKRKRHFKCKGTKTCVIKGKKHNLCGYCRYSRCLALGMSKTAIKTGRYTHDKRAQDSQEVQRLVSAHTTLDITEAEVTEVVRRLMHVHSKVVTNAHVPEAVMQRRAEEIVEEFQLKREMFGLQGALTPEQYDEVFRVTGLDVDERQKDMKFVARSIDFFAHGYVRFGKGVPGFDRLSFDDRANLLKLARVEVWFLGAYRGFMKDYDVFYAPNSDVRHRVELEKMLGGEYVDYAFQLAHCLQAMNLSFEEVVVLKAICLTFGDRCDMDDAALVEEIQWRMLKCFLHLIRQNHPEDSNLFYRVTNCLVRMRNLTELSRKALANTHFTDAIRNNATMSDLILV